MASDSENKVNTRAVNGEVDSEVDARGLSCPLPLLQAKRALNGLAPGARLKVLATDPGSVRDFHSWMELSGHRMISFTEESQYYCYIVQKKST